MVYSVRRWLVNLTPTRGGCGRLQKVFSRRLSRTSDVRTGVTQPSSTRQPRALNQSAAQEFGCTHYYYNRNPRNFELLGVAEKPKGFATKWERFDYYHRLTIDLSTRHTSAYVTHNNGFRVVEASTKEFCIARHLYKTNDVAAAYNIGRVIAERCKETGLYRVMWQHSHKKGQRPMKVDAFLRALKARGLVLNEPRVRKGLPEPGKLPL